MSKTLNRCFLKNGGIGEAIDDFDAWAATGDVCQDTDFVVESDALTTAELEEEADRNLGIITITQKVDLAVDFVVTPNLPLGESTSIEVTGMGMDIGADRVMV